MIPRLLLFLLPLWSAAASDLDQAPWDTLLKRYVSAESLVDYAAWKRRDIPALDAYLRQIARPWAGGLSMDARKAAMIDAYNALTIRWVLANYPVKSIWRTDSPFSAPRQVVNGHKVSLDDIESELRRMADPRIHAALVCGARSCPPLRREAYTGPRLDAQLDDNMRAWLGNPRLNQFVPEQKVARVSMLFKWYRGDFESSAYPLDRLFARYAPPGRYSVVEFLPYQWGLNDASGLGSDYTGTQFLFDRARNLL